MKCYVIAGEASGDLHGSNLLKALRQADPHAVFRCWGGDLMQAAGGEVVKHYRDLAFMGFAEVVKNLPTILGNLKWCKKDILAWQPDVLVLVDYPGFNLRIAEWAKAQGFRVVYYIAPQVWAWKPARVKKMKTSIDLMLCILPFEQAYFANQWQWATHYVGHPLVEAIAQFRAATPSVENIPAGCIALLPGSRQQEIALKLPLMLAAAAQFPHEVFVVAQAPGQEAQFYAPFLSDHPNVRLVNNKTYAILERAKAALVTSGTATLETALFGVPEVVCYKGSAISYAIAKRLIKIKYISLVNLIMDQELVKELIQDQLSVPKLTQALQDILTPQVSEKIKLGYGLLQDKLQAGGEASKQAAEKIMAFLSETKAGQGS
ncbi:MAG: lipid-A-disaccharide synthase [Sphingobacteriia bacterium]|nr:MAG: lipid-A-disaccharide synthase [Sphingobacteriia bacterium]